MSHAVHVPVLLEETLSVLRPTPGGRYVDCTLGAGGHAAGLLERADRARLLGLDADPSMLAVAAERLRPFGDRARLVHANFAELEEVARREGFVDADGVLFDLGVSSLHLDQPERGFSFQVDAPLDMRLDRTDGPTAADLLRDLDERELADVIYRYGEEPRARRIARAIVRERGRQGGLRTTGQLAGLITRIVPHGRIHPATRTFQALRIAVNRELDVLPDALRQAHAILRDGGRLAVISFHSLEDRIVKRYIAEQASPCTCPPRAPLCTCGRTPRLEPITRKPIVASQGEVAGNPRSRSAKLRGAARLGPPL
ncbi:MAG TPA: 16S rRNA (cytosine(1402)-N(4))-methyltransferase RsmH [Chloroflexota bacterium]|jgi:16S rRNA (cytosine1402-N4)-methyltransferase|nr:16S rRNA (cytosine(1402)-N(4))-methyltransferase RsmH [Chloroflexota bacterium]